MLEVSERYVAFYYIKGVAPIQTSGRENGASVTTAHGEVATVPATAATTANAVSTVSHSFSSAVTVHGSQEY